MIAIAEDALRQIPPGRRYRTGYAHLSLSMALTSSGRIEEALERTAAFIERESARIDAASIRGYFARTIAHWQAGRLARCEQAAADQLQLAAMNGLPVVAGWGALFLAACAYERGDLAGAGRHASAVIAEGERTHFMSVREAYFVQVLTYEAQGLREEADRTLARLVEIALGLESDYQVGIVDSFQARIALMRGDLTAARRWLEISSAAPSYSDLKAYEQPALTRAKILIAQGTPGSLAEADKLLTTFVDFARSRHMTLSVIESLAVQALLRERQVPVEADNLLQASLGFGGARRDDTSHCLPGCGTATAVVLRGTRPPHPHARPVLTALEALLGVQKRAAGMSAAQADLVVSPLTEREREVMHLLARRLTNTEIGDQLFISPITVKNHVAHICDKLGRLKRRAAVQRAEALGLL
ncbi:MAG: LuxR C-terminal-related transcriptional regulator [Thermomicrobiales bacterium]